MPDYKKMLQQLADAYNDRDPDAFAAHWNSDSEWHPVLARPDGDPGYYGHNGISSWFEDVDEMYEYVKFHVDFDELRQVGDSLLVRGRINAWGRGVARRSPATWDGCSRRVARNSSAPGAT